MNITLFSFGFKHGQPQADMLWDVRFLPNPYWVEALRGYTGKEAEVARYALDNPTGAAFLALLEPLLLFMLEAHAGRGREALTLAVGCTGGRHRSVALAEHLSVFLQRHGFPTVVHHRDIDK